MMRTSRCATGSFGHPDQRFVSPHRVGSAVVGGVAAAAAAIASTPEGEETDLAIVQVSVDTIDIEDRSRRGCGSRVPPASGVKVTSTEGTGQLTATVEVDEDSLPEDPQPVELGAKGRWEGKDAGATVTVQIGGDNELRLY
jgi:hypothetical protein